MTATCEGRIGIAGSEGRYEQLTVPVIGMELRTGQHIINPSKRWFEPYAYCLPSQDATTVLGDDGLFHPQGGSQEGQRPMIIAGATLLPMR